MDSDFFQKLLSKFSVWKGKGLAPYPFLFLKKYAVVDYIYSQIGPFSAKQEKLAML